MKQKQHPRKYKSGKITVVNKGFLKNWFVKKPEPESNTKSVMSEDYEIIKDIKDFEKSLPGRNNHEFIWLEGNGNVILSAPHAVKHFRKVLVRVQQTKKTFEEEIDELGAQDFASEDKVMSYIKGADDYTGGIAFVLNKLTKMPTIIFTRQKGWDPNIYDGVPYKSSIKNHVEGKVLLIDIHGADINRDFDIAIGNCVGKSLLEHSGYQESLIRHLRNQGIRNVKINPPGFGAGGENSQHTVTYYASHILKIPALQIEVNERYRNPYKHPECVLKFIRAMESFLKE